MTKRELKKIIVEVIQSMTDEPALSSTPVFKHPALTVDYKEYDDKIQLNKLKVKEPYRGRGIGTKALKSVISLAQKSHKPIIVPWLHGDFDAKDTQVKRFFEKNGFVSQGENLVWRS